MRMLPVLLQFLVIGPLALGAAPAAAISEDAPTPEVLAFERFIRASGPVCEQEAAAICFDLGFEFADLSGDDRLALPELLTVRDSLASWVAWRGDSLTARERNLIRLGTWLVDSVGIGALLDSYDEDGDALLDRRELAADVSFDERPLGVVLLDPEAVDRAAVARRLGALVPFLEQALPPVD